MIENQLICRDEVAKELRSALSHIKLSSEGVYVQASTLGSLEALLEFLKASKIPVSSLSLWSQTFVANHLSVHNLDHECDVIMK